MSVDWNLLWHPLFEERFQGLLERVEELATRDPDGFYNHRDYKFFESVSNCIEYRIITGPGNKEFNLSTLGKKYKNWRRAKNGLPSRYRLFFQYSSKSTEIVLVWLNDEVSIRRAGHKKDVYEVFKKMLESNIIPNSYNELVKESNFTERFGS
ncbi:MAG: type II toxin-antitoxin system YhaV family toxin [Candidatus Electrothrix communis]|jgi:toxin YhaV|nr:MAG: type II toxin-antitoxin system YhaV family toxin [Candidatus Electrothrix communis]